MDSQTIQIIIYSAVVIGAIILCIIIAWLIRKFRKHRHNFKYVSCLTCKDMPRKVSMCEKCGVSIHEPIYSRKQLEEIESGTI